MKIVINNEAFKIETGPTLLLAGPGTGKTYQLAKRIQFLTSLGVQPGEITVITFTTEAASSMRKKIEDKGSQEFIEPENRPGRISTMHSLGNSILADNLELANLQANYQVVENQQVREALMVDASLLCGLSSSDGYKALDERIRSVSPNTYPRVIEEYEKILRACNSIDYDDQILLSVKLLKEHSDLRKDCAKNAKYLLVDEYQDINMAQFELIKLLSSENPQGLFVVGDDDQSIYGFRGGTPGFIRNFERDFGPKVIVCSMNVSRRCLRNIFESAYCLIGKFDLKRIPKGQCTYLNTEPGLVVNHDCPSDDREAEIIASIAKDKITAAKEQGKDPGDFLVLIPTKFYGEKIHKALQRFGINSDFKLSLSEGFFKVINIKKWLENNSSNLLTRLVIQFIVDSGSVGLPSSRAYSPTSIMLRTKGLKKIAGLWQMVTDKNISLIKALEICSKNDVFLENIFTQLTGLQDLYSKGNVSPFLQMLGSNIRPWSNNESFLKDVEKLVFDKEKSRSADNYVVRIMSYQGAKGLEAEYVFAVGLEEGTIPRATEEEKLAEEARLLFVAMTRAKNELHLFHCRKRTGAATLRSFSPKLGVSQFLNVLPKDKIKSNYHPRRAD